ncbi:hypothetical protein CCACVL1_09226, partial [Corchorus capsularis]
HIFSLHIAFHSKHWPSKGPAHAFDYIPRHLTDRIQAGIEFKQATST